MPRRHTRADKGLIGVTSPKEADAGAVGRVPRGTDSASATDAARAMGAALADLGSALDDIVTDEEKGRPQGERVPPRP
jgi:hypothetical protein